MHNTFGNTLCILFFLQDWGPVLTFISEAIENLWKEFVSYGKPSIWHAVFSIIVLRVSFFLYFFYNSFPSFDGEGGCSGPRLVFPFTLVQGLLKLV